MNSSAVTLVYFWMIDMNVVIETNIQHSRTLPSHVRVFIKVNQNLYHYL